MCAIFGALVFGTTQSQIREANHVLSYIYNASEVRGRDGRGYAVFLQGEPPFVHKSTARSEAPNWDGGAPPQINADEPLSPSIVLGNMRAEPTTEYVAEKKESDQQPYTVANWTIVHNGTIANDKELRTGKLPTSIDSAAIPEMLALSKYADFRSFVDGVQKLKGSYAIIAKGAQSDAIYVACNYRPIWYISTEFGIFFASTRECFPARYVPKMVEPYSAMRFATDRHRTTVNLRAKGPATPKALVVCSGGLDSVVSAVYAQKVLGYDVGLIHFKYGSRAEGPEVAAVKEIASHMGASLKLFDLPVYDKADSPLLNGDAIVAGGEAGAEFAHEWVPARNLLLLSVATAYAEAKGFDFLVLGNNLEEAGAYPDNEPEFIAKFNDLLPFAVGDGKQLRVLMPVGNMMKHEIVKLGAAIGAPMHLTWSCYRAGEKHCGSCGPCFMRGTAFKINDLPEVIQYDSSV